MSKNYTTVALKKEDLQIISKYCKIFRWSPSQLFSALATQIKEKIPELSDKTIDELQKYADSRLAIQVRLEHI